MREEAIFKLYPNVIQIDGDRGALDKDLQPVLLDEKLIKKKVKELQDKKDKYLYRELRAPEYPSIYDYIDGVVKGDQEQIKKYIDECLAVKAKYPKNGKEK
jgi:hypothetical protein